MKRLNGILLMGIVLLGGVFLLNMGVFLNSPVMAGGGGVVMVFALVQAYVFGADRIGRTTRFSMRVEESAQWSAP